MSFLDILRKKPKAVKENFAVVGAICVTAVIVGVWVTTLPGRYEVVAIEESVEETEGVFKQFFSSIKSQFATVRSAVAEVASTTATSTAEVVATTSPATIVIPTLSDKEIRELNPRTILIATSSNISTTTP